MPHKSDSDPVAYRSRAAFRSLFALNTSMRVMLRDNRGQAFVRQATPMLLDAGAFGALSNCPGAIRPAFFRAVQP